MTGGCQIIGILLKQGNLSSSAGNSVHFVPRLPQLPSGCEQTDRSKSDHIENEGKPSLLNWGRREAEIGMQNEDPN